MQAATKSPIFSHFRFISSFKKKLIFTNFFQVNAKLVLAQYELMMHKVDLSKLCKKILMNTWFIIIVIQCQIDGLLLDWK